MLVQTAIHAARLAEASYRRLDAQHVVRFERANAAGLVAFDDVDTWIVIRGSDDVYDWMYNANTRQVDTGGWWMHRGFTDYAKLVVDAVLDLQAQAKIPSTWYSRRVYVVGHSLGGAAARILPCLFAGIRIHHVITFGAPQSHAPTSAALYQWPLIEFRCVYDPVPHLPRGRWGECGKVVRINGSNLVSGPEGTFSRWRRRTWLMAMAWTGQLAKQVNKHHTMTHYLEKLQAVQEVAA